MTVAMELTWWVWPEMMQFVRPVGHAAYALIFQQLQFWQCQYLVTS